MPNKQKKKVNKSLQPSHEEKNFIGMLGIASLLMILFYYEVLHAILESKLGPSSDAMLFFCGTALLGLIACYTKVGRIFDCFGYTICGASTMAAIYFSSNNSAYLIRGIYAGFAWAVIFAFLFATIDCYGKDILNRSALNVIMVVCGAICVMQFAINVRKYHIDSNLPFMLKNIATAISFVYSYCILNLSILHLPHRSTFIIKIFCNLLFFPIFTVNTERNSKEYSRSKQLPSDREFIPAPPLSREPIQQNTEQKLPSSPPTHRVFIRHTKKPYYKDDK